MTTDRPCKCDHHRLSHAFNGEGNSGRCLAYPRCDCTAYEPAPTEPTYVDEYRAMRRTK